MHGPHSEPALQKLVAMIRDRTGNMITQSRLPFLEELAQRRARAKGFGSVTDYVTALEAGSIPGEWESLVPLVTIKESYFFRAPQQFEVIRAHILPEILQARSQKRQLRIWSAACARGEEPATLAMVLAEEKSLAGWDWTIFATDVDEEALGGARLGLYGDRAVAQVPPELAERYLSRRGKLFELDPGLRARISYQTLNLAHPPYSLPFREWDLILLRNVLIYFRRPLQRRVVTQVSHLLAPHGHLFLGASETLWQIQDELEAVDHGSCFVYRHRRGPRQAPALAKPTARRPAADPDDRDGKALRPASPAPKPAVPPAPPPRASRPPAPAPPTPPVLEPLGIHQRLTEVARHLAANRVEEAGRAIGQVLAADPSEPAAHALEGFLHDLTGRTDDAVASYRAALYLDPALFQVRVLLADCLLRLGNRDRAEHHYREVLAHLAGGRERTLDVFAELPFPDRARAQRRCRQVLASA
ncbi:MAG TPA: CheR family methyltransferase [Thermoanaerobaculia bacterium]